MAHLHLDDRGTRAVPIVMTGSGGGGGLYLVAEQRQELEELLADGLEHGGLEVGGLEHVGRALWMCACVVGGRLSVSCLFARISVLEGHEFRF